MVEWNEQEGRRQGIYCENQGDKLSKCAGIEQIQRKQATTREGGQRSLIVRDPTDRSPHHDLAMVPSGCSALLIL